MTLAEHEGEAYCKSCHKKMWGPTGYGYGSGLLVREDPESQFKQSIGRPVNSSTSDTASASYNNLDDAITYHSTGGSSSAGDFASSRPAHNEETEEQRHERLTPVNSTQKKRNSLDMIREQAEASRRAYDDAHAQRVANKYGRVNPNLTGGSTASTGSGKGEHLFSGSNYNGSSSGYLSGGSDTSSAFGSTMATTSSPAPSLSSISSVASSNQPATKSLYLNHPLRSSSAMSSSSFQEPQDAESDYARSRQALSFQTGAPPQSSGSYTPTQSGPPPLLPKRDFESKVAAPSPQPGSEQGDDSYLEYAPIRIVARKEEPHSSKAASTPPAVDEDEWGTEPTEKKKHAETTTPAQPMYQSQYLQQQRQQQQERESAPAAPSPSSSSVRPNQLISEADKLNLREQEERQQQARTSEASTVGADEWDEEPTPTVPSTPQNIKYMPARNVSSAAIRTWTPTANTSSDYLSSNTHSRTASAEPSVSPTTATNPVNSSNFGATAPKTSYYRSGGSMTPKRATSSYGGGGDICPRCQKIVYHAESALAPGGAKYHKLCLRCVECSKSLDSTNMTDRQGTPYCKTCYGKAFGAKGYGYGSGASMLHTEL
ncbi:hypothetical protein BGZ54_003135 [Gamsiella multidivaricata]|nr:hypothetical protein BGZ54_003135 [Gamsiella multidivaricata]